MKSFKKPLFLLFSFSAKAYLSSWVFLLKLQIYKQNIEMFFSERFLMGNYVLLKKVV